MCLVVRDADRPVRLLLPFPPRKSLRVEKRQPATLPRTSRAVKDRQETFRVVHDRDLKRRKQKF